MSTAFVLEAIASDVRYAARTLRRTPVFTVAAVLCLAIGIGANTTMFGVVDALLLRPPADVVDPGGVVKLWVTRHYTGLGPEASSTMSYLDYTDFRDAKSFAATAAYSGGQELTLGHGPDAQQVRATLATASFFPLLGVHPALGRFYGADDDRVGASPVAVLDYGFWQRHFAGSRAVLGRQLQLANEMYTIIGVAPDHFTGVELASTDVWLPMARAASHAIMGPDALTSRGWFFLETIARLRPGVTTAQAVDEATRVHRAGRGAGPREDPNAQVALGGIIGVSNGAPKTVSKGGPAAGPKASGASDAQVSLWLAGVAAVVLLIACANVANLLLVRAVRRQREIAIRLALGVGRGRLVRQLLTESTLLAVVGGFAGLLVAHWGGAVIRHFLLPDVAALDAPFDGRMLLFALGGTVFTGLACGLVPALRSSRPDVASALKAGAREGTFRRSLLRSGLLVGQIALSLVLLVGAGLFVRSLHNVRGTDFGFDVNRLVLANVDLQEAGYSTPQIVEFYAQARDRMAALPGVESASDVVAVPFNSMVATSFTIPGRDTLPQVRRPPLINPVSTDYFATTGTHLLRGRGFTAAEALPTSHVAVVNEAMAKLYWPNQNPVGSCIKIGRVRPPAPDTLPCYEIVGVAENIKEQGLREDPVPQYYVPIAAFPQYAMRSLLVRAKGDPSNVVGSVRRTLQAMGSNLPFADVRPFSVLLDPQMRPWKLGATLFGIFGGVALVLALVGLYGVLAYTVVQRRQEIGVRIALGAQSSNVLGVVVGEGLRVALAGVAIGAAVALAGGRFIQSLLFDVGAADPPTFIAMGALLLVAAVAASWVPAWRATRVDPAIALRAE